jgi:UDP-N-acetylmuramoylalanine--D-glutamate ligase
VSEARRLPVSGLSLPPGGWGRCDDRVVLGDLEIPLETIPRTDAVMLVDIAAAAAAARHMGATPEGIREAATGFTAGPHRREVVGTWDGVTWIDDSKATNPHAALAAIRDHDSVVLIAGGRNKGLDVSPIPLQPNLRLVVAIGEAASELAAAGGPVKVATSLEEAVAIADATARTGDTVLLAPGCASFDMFHSYADRGERFAALVRSRKES